MPRTHRTSTRPRGGAGDARRRHTTAMLSQETWLYYRSARNLQAVARHYRACVRVAWLAETLRLKEPILQAQTAGWRSLGDGARVAQGQARLATLQARRQTLLASIPAYRPTPRTASAENLSSTSPYV